MEEVKETITEDVSTTDQATNTESTSEINGEPFKVFTTEDDFNKFLKSESMKKVNALYKELNVKTLDELKEIISFKEKYTELDGKFNALSDEYNNYKSENEAALQEKESLGKELTLSKLGITDDEDLREDFIISVEALSARKEISFEEAAESYLSRHPEFKNLSFRNGIRIGSDKSTISEDPETGIEKEFKKINPWYKR